VRFASLGSGSKGNATLLQSADTLLMVDCGFSLRQTTVRLERLGVRPQDLSAILVTHEHSDHIGGVAALSAAFDIPVYLTHGTLRSGRLSGAAQVRCFNAGEALRIGDIDVQSVVVPHDAREPCQYLFSARGCRVGVLTDLGSVTPHVVEAYRDCHALLLEFNHDSDLLRRGPYPPVLQARVGGDWGHLNNLQACDFLRQVQTPALRQLAIAHISEQNNSASAVQRVLTEHFPAAPWDITWADQSDGFAWQDVGPAGTRGATGADRGRPTVA
jgi:phosphoribosyl 1,2-cyclic phosphodiesterase